ncbi:MAG: hypothetical protein KGJ13_06420 [Patescibacteria group bacterium]|nr:hypothetical protein [Patescibacteria group bacterium]
MVVNPTPVQYKRLFIDVPTSVNDKLVAEAKARGVSKKALVESLILDMASKPVSKKERNK